jgi:hypothetical protein
MFLFQHVTHFHMKMSYLILILLVIISSAKSEGIVGVLNQIPSTRVGVDTDGGVLSMSSSVSATQLFKLYPNKTQILLVDTSLSQKRDYALWNSIKSVAFGPLNSSGNESEYVYVLDGLSIKKIDGNVSTTFYSFSGSETCFSIRMTSRGILWMLCINSNGYYLLNFTDTGINKINVVPNVISCWKQTLSIDTNDILYVYIDAVYRVINGSVDRWIYLSCNGRDNAYFGNTVPDGSSVLMVNSNDTSRIYSLSPLNYYLSPIYLPTFVSNSIVGLWVTGNEIFIMFSMFSKGNVQISSSLWQMRQTPFVNTSEIHPIGYFFLNMDFNGNLINAKNGIAYGSYIPIDISSCGNRVLTPSTNIVSEINNGKWEILSGISGIVFSRNGISKAPSTYQLGLIPICGGIAMYSSVFFDGNIVFNQSFPTEISGNSISCIETVGATSSVQIWAASNLLTVYNTIYTRKINSYEFNVSGSIFGQGTYKIGSPYSIDIAGYSENIKLNINSFLYSSLKFDSGDLLIADDLGVRVMYIRYLNIIPSNGCIGSTVSINISLPFSVSITAGYLCLFDVFPSLIISIQRIQSFGLRESLWTLKCIVPSNLIIGTVNVVITSSGGIPISTSVEFINNGQILFIPTSGMGGDYIRLTNYQYQNGDICLFDNQYETRVIQNGTNWLCQVPGLSIVGPIQIEIDTYDGYSRYAYNIFYNLLPIIYTPQCPIGFILNNLNCVPCPSGSSSDGTVSTQCFPCPNGYDSSGGGVCKRCFDGWASFTGGLCVNCANEVSLNSPCVPCGLGMGRTGSGSCGLCLPGQVNNQSDNILCQLCPTGWVSNANRTNCFPCEAGSISYDNECILCPDRSISSTGSIACTFCSNGTISNGITCSSCPSGSIQKDNECELCPLGTYSQQGTTECIDCPAGTFGDTNGCHNCSDSELCLYRSVKPIPNELITEKNVLIEPTEESEELLSVSIIQAFSFSFIDSIYILISCTFILLMSLRNRRVKKLLRSADLFYDLNHDVAYGHSPIKVKKPFGGVFTIASIIACILVTSSSISNYIMIVNTPIFTPGLLDISTRMRVHIWISIKWVDVSPPREWKCNDTVLSIVGIQSTNNVWSITDTTTECDFTFDCTDCYIDPLIPINFITKSSDVTVGRVVYSLRVFPSIILNQVKLSKDPYSVYVIRGTSDRMIGGNKCGEVSSGLVVYQVDSVFGFQMNIYSITDTDYSNVYNSDNICFMITVSINPNIFDVGVNAISSSVATFLGASWGNITFVIAVGAVFMNKTESFGLWCSKKNRSKVVPLNILPPQYLRNSLYDIRSKEMPL